MFQISVAQLFEDNRDRLGLSWVTQPPATPALIRRDTQDSAALVGHINLIHPNRLQVLGAPEAARLTQTNADGTKLITELLAPSPAMVIVGDDAQADSGLIEAATRYSVALLRSSAPSALVIDTLRRYFARKLAETTSLHGVCMDVLGLGVLITGESGVGKSELALELISRGHGLVADDVVEISHIGLGTLEARCPPMLKDFLEVRGLGMLNIRTIFGETAVRPRMRLRLVVNLLRPSPTQSLTRNDLRTNRDARGERIEVGIEEVGAVGHLQGDAVTGQLGIEVLLGDLAVAHGIDEPPGLRVVGGGCPTSRFQDRHEHVTGNRLIGHGAR